jgi:hypothetical protein
MILISVAIWDHDGITVQPSCRCPAISCRWRGYNVYQAIRAYTERALRPCGFYPKRAEGLKCPLSHEQRTVRREYVTSAYDP